MADETGSIALRLQFAFYNFRNLVIGCYRVAVKDSREKSKEIDSYQDDSDKISAFPKCSVHFRTTKIIKSGRCDAKTAVLVISKN